MGRGHCNCNWVTPTAGCSSARMATGMIVVEEAKGIIRLIEVECWFVCHQVRSPGCSVSVHFPGTSTHLGVEGRGNAGGGEWPMRMQRPVRAKAVPLLRLAPAPHRWPFVPLYASRHGPSCLHMMW